MFRGLIQECRQHLVENALNPDMHRDAVKALENEKRAQIPAMKSTPKIRGRNTLKPQTMTSRGWRDIEEFGSPGRRFDAY